MDNQTAWAITKAQLALDLGCDPSLLDSQKRDCPLAGLPGPTEIQRPDPSAGGCRTPRQAGGGLR